MDELRYRPSFRGFAKPHEAVALAAVVVLGLAMTVVYGAGSDDGFGLVAMAVVYSVITVWHLVVNGTAVDGEGFTSTRFTKSVSLSWSEVQEVRAEPGVRVVLVYDEIGERLRLHDVPAKDVDAIRELWTAGRGEDWERNLRLPEPAPTTVTATTGLGGAAALAAVTGLVGLVVVSIIDDEAGLFEVAAATRQDLVVVLLWLVIAPVVAFTATLTLSRRRLREGAAPTD
ncbi:hypothetical protein [Amycolatopsis magusensis]|uniref:PH domain-containing protein n=1 Tax=Amycolatopsis magusensis TaxID=882444 RepID=A0ABS4PYQ9_9PSEU|nr:hypothetical protein [Amycolatopsis magusensis]MBP2183998.1 hypothetical protein [Amycolatopsis magusensis]